MYKSLVKGGTRNYLVNLINLYIVYIRSPKYCFTSSSNILSVFPKPKFWLLLHHVLYISVFLKLSPYENNIHSALLISLTRLLKSRSKGRENYYFPNCTQVFCEPKWSLVTHHGTPVSQMGQEALTTLICLILLIKITLNTISS